MYAVKSGSVDCVDLKHTSTAEHGSAVGSASTALAESESAAQHVAHSVVHVTHRTFSACPWFTAQHGQG